MTPKIFQTVIALCTTGLLGGAQLNAQEAPKNSLSLGMAAGPTFVGYPAYNTLGLGMDLSYEYRLLPYLSVQTSLCQRYSFPRTLTLNYEYDANASGELAQSVVKYNQKHFSFRVAPCFYLRQEYFSLFTGISWAIGNYSLSTTTENQYANYPSPGEFYRKTFDDEERHSTYGFSPFLGAAVAVGGSGRDDEVMLCFSFNQHRTPAPTDADYHYAYYAGYRSLEMTAAYRINF